MILETIHICFEFLSLAIALISYSRLKNTFMVYFIPFLVILISSEIIAWHSSNTVILYAILNPLTHCFYAFIFCNYIISIKQKRIFIYVAAIYCMLCVTGHFFDDSQYSLFYYLIASGGLMQVYFSCTFFYQYLTSDDITLMKKWDSGLWIASGLLIFYSAVTICFSLHGYIKENELKIFGLYLYHIIPRVLSPILYSCLCISFILWKNPKEILS